MEYIYGQLNNENIVIGISSLSGEVSSPDMIRIESFDASLLGKKYENGVFIEVPQEPTPIV